MKRISEYTAYTLKEILEHLQGSAINNAPYYIKGYNIFEGIALTDYTGDGSFAFVKYNTSSEVYEFYESVRELYNTLYNRFYNQFCLIVEEGEDIGERAEECLTTIFNITNNTFEKYNALYELYEDNKADLLRAVQTSANRETTHKFKDTPQADITPSSDAYNTTVNYTKDDVTSTDERDTIIARLAEINDKFKNLMLDWTNEFERLFINEYNI